MGIINLTTAKTPEESSIPYKKGLITVIIVAIIVALAYGAIYVYKKQLLEKITKSDKDYATELATLTGSGNKDVVDFQNRIILANSLIAKRNMSLEGLAEIEKDILPEVYIESFEYDKVKNETNLNCVAKDIESVARQILVFKGSGLFKEVVPGGIKVQEKGRVEFPLNLHF